MAHVVQNEGAASIQDVKNLIHLEMSMDWNSDSRRNLLCSHRETRQARIRLDEDVATTQNEVFAFRGLKHVTL